ncbi:MAG: RnfABCDGE type electron transport complex subunit G [Clostridia bacterium]|nr:RnfABCDGE type electron transport complex subunit G [Clostridia bacterium]
MRDIIKLGIFLMVVGIISGLCVSYISGLTQPIIEAQAKAAEQAGLEEVYPDAEQMEDKSSEYVTDAVDPMIKQVNVAYEDGEEVGVIYTVAPAGYDGPITLMAGFDLEEESITNIKVLGHSETPGLGDACTKPEFVEKFQNKMIAEPLGVVKQEPAGEYEIVAITASTITTEAVVDGVNAAREHFIEYFVE